MGEMEQDEFAPGTDYEPDPPTEAPEEVPAGGKVNLSPKQFRMIQAPMISDPEDSTGARCFDAGPEVKAEGKIVGLPCIRKRGHSGVHRSMQGEHPESRVFHEWETPQPQTPAEAQRAKSDRWKTK
jgi:hypothetical protein